MDPVTIGLGIAGLAGQIFGATKGGQANRANQRLLNAEKIDNEKFYNLNSKQNFLDTNAAKGIFERLRKNVYNANKTVDSNAAATGATAEASIAAKSKNQENYNDAVNQLASKATDYQQNQEAIYRGEKARITGEQMDINNQKAQNAANLASNAGNLLSAAAPLSAWDELKNKKPGLTV